MPSSYHRTTAAPKAASATRRRRAGVGVQAHQREQRSIEVFMETSFLPQRRHSMSRGLSAISLQRRLAAAGVLLSVVGVLRVKGIAN